MVRVTVLLTVLLFSAGAVIRASSEDEYGGVDGEWMRDCIFTAAGSSCDNTTAWNLLDECLATNANDSIYTVHFLLGPQAGTKRVLEAILPPPPGDPGVSWVVNNRSAWGADLMNLARGRESHYDGLVLDPVIMPEMVASRALMDLRPYVATDQWMNQWPGILSGLRWLLSNHDSQAIYMLPLGAAVMVLHYRQDVLAAHGLGVPRTWEQLLYAVRQVHGRPAGPEAPGNGSFYGFCTLPFIGCHADAYELMAIWGSFIQTHGIKQGAFFDPATLTPLVNNAAMAAALSYYRALASYGPPWSLNATTNCSSMYGTAEPVYERGSCAFQIAPHPTHKRNTLLAPSRDVRRHTRVTALPGATVVLDRRTGRLVPCTYDTCPFAVPVHGWPDDAAVQAGVLASSGVPELMEAAAAGGGGTAVDGQDGDGLSHVLANMAPVLGLSPLALAINGFTSPRQRTYSIRWLRRVTESETLWSLVTSPETPLSPFRYEHFSQSNRDRWLAEGYDAHDIDEYLKLVFEVLSNDNLVSAPLALQRFLDYRGALHEGAFNASYSSPSPFSSASAHSGPPSSIARIMADMAIMLSVPYSTVSSVYGTLRLQYLASIGRDDLLAAPAPPPPPPPPIRREYVGRAQRPGDVRGPGSQAALTVGAAVGCLGTVGAIALAAFLYKQLMVDRGWGRSKDPGVGPETTLVVTDIEGSTVLWEELDALVMDVALNLHHDTVRRVIAEWYGYESVTEGDSFTVAFHSAEAAVGFSLHVQSELMEQPWPAEVLGHQACRPVHVVSTKRLKHIIARAGARAAAAAAAALTAMDTMEAEAAVAASGGSIPSGPASSGFRPSALPALRTLSKVARRIDILSGITSGVRRSSSFINRPISGSMASSTARGGGVASMLALALAGGGGSGTLGTHGTGGPASATTSGANAIPRRHGTGDSVLLEPGDNIGATSTRQLFDHFLPYNATGGTAPGGAAAAASPPPVGELPSATAHTCGGGGGSPFAVASTSPSLSLGRLPGSLTIPDNHGGVTATTTAAAAAAAAAAVATHHTTASSLWPAASSSFGGRHTRHQLSHFDSADRSDTPVSSGAEQDAAAPAGPLVPGSGAGISAAQLAALHGVGSGSGVGGHAARTGILSSATNAALAAAAAAAAMTSVGGPLGLARPGSGLRSFANNLIPSVPEEPPPLTLIVRRTRSTVAMGRGDGLAAAAAAAAAGGGDTAYTSPGDLSAAATTAAARGVASVNGMAPSRGPLRVAADEAVALTGRRPSRMAEAAPLVLQIGDDSGYGSFGDIRPYGDGGGRTTAAVDDLAQLYDGGGGGAGADAGAAHGGQTPREFSFLRDARHQHMMGEGQEGPPARALRGWRSWTGLSFGIVRRVQRSFRVGAGGGAVAAAANAGGGTGGASLVKPSFSIFRHFAGGGAAGGDDTDGPFAAEAAAAAAAEQHLYETMMVERDWASAAAAGATPAAAAAGGGAVASGAGPGWDVESRSSSQSHGTPTSTMSHGTSIRSMLVHPGRRRKRGGGAAGEGKGRVKVLYSSPATYGSELQSTWSELPADLDVDPASVGAVLVFRGFRVRCGMHSGVRTSAEINRHHPSGRTRYSGPVLLCAKAISDAAHGGMVFATRHTLELCPATFLASRVVVWRLGDHVLGSPRLPASIYQLSNTALVLRAVLHRPLTRVHLPLSLGLLDAPLTVVACAAIKLSASSLLEGVHPAISIEAAAVFQALAYQYARIHGGYLAQLGVGRALCVFGDAYRAALWAVTVQDRMFWHAWSEALLATEQCRMRVLTDAQGNEIVVGRGPRIKCVVHFGPVSTMLHPLTGQLSYEGGAVDLAMRLLNGLGPQGVVATLEAAASLRRYNPPNADGKAVVIPSQSTNSNRASRTQPGMLPGGLAGRQLDVEGGATSSGAGSGGGGGGGAGVFGGGSGDPGGSQRSSGLAWREPAARASPHLLQHHPRPHPQPPSLPQPLSRPGSQSQTPFLTVTAAASLDVLSSGFDGTSSGGTSGGARGVGGGGGDTAAAKGHRRPSTTGSALCQSPGSGGRAPVSRVMSQPSTRMPDAASGDGAVAGGTSIDQRAAAGPPQRRASGSQHDGTFLPPPPMLHDTTAAAASDRLVHAAGLSPRVGSPHPASPTIPLTDSANTSGTEGTDGAGATRVGSRTDNRLGSGPGGSGGASGAQCSAASRGHNVPRFSLNLGLSPLVARAVHDGCSGGAGGRVGGGTAPAAGPSAATAAAAPAGAPTAATAAAATAHNDSLLLLLTTSVDLPNTTASAALHHTAAGLSNSTQAMPPRLGSALAADRSSVSFGTAAAAVAAKSNGGAFGRPLGGAYTASGSRRHRAPFRTTSSNGTSPLHGWVAANMLPYKPARGSMSQLDTQMTPGTNDPRVVVEGSSGSRQPQPVELRHQSVSQQQEQQQQQRQEEQQEQQKRAATAAAGMAGSYRKAIRQTSGRTAAEAAAQSPAATTGGGSSGRAATPPLAGVPEITPAAPSPGNIAAVPSTASATSPTPPPPLPRSPVPTSHAKPATRNATGAAPTSHSPAAMPPVPPAQPSRGRRPLPPPVAPTGPPGLAEDSAASGLSPSKLSSAEASSDPEAGASGASTSALPSPLRSRPVPAATSRPPQRQLRTQQSARNTPPHVVAGAAGYGGGGRNACEPLGLHRVHQSFTFGQRGGAVARPRLQDLLAVSPYPAAPGTTGASTAPAAAVQSRATAGDGGGGSDRPDAPSGSTGAYGMHGAPQARAVGCGEPTGDVAASMSASSRQAAAMWGVPGGLAGSGSLDALIRGPNTRISRSFTFTTLRRSPLAVSSYAGDPEIGVGGGAAAAATARGSGGGSGGGAGGGPLNSAAMSGVVGGSARPLSGLSRVLYGAAAAVGVVTSRDGASGTSGSGAAAASPSSTLPSPGGGVGAASAAAAAATVRGGIRRDGSSGRIVGSPGWSHQTSRGRRGSQPLSSQLSNSLLEAAAAAAAAASGRSGTMRAGPGGYHAATSTGLTVSPSAPAWGPLLGLSPPPPAAAAPAHAATAIGLTATGTGTTEYPHSSNSAGTLRGSLSQSAQLRSSIGDPRGSGTGGRCSPASWGSGAAAAVAAAAVATGGVADVVGSGAAAASAASPSTAKPASSLGGPGGVASHVSSLLSRVRNVAQGSRSRSLPRGNSDLPGSPAGASSPRGASAFLSGPPLSTRSGDTAATGAARGSGDLPSASGASTRGATGSLGQPGGTGTGGGSGTSGGSAGRVLRSVVPGTGEKLPTLPEAAGLAPLMRELRHLQLRLVPLRLTGRGGAVKGAAALAAAEAAERVATGSTAESGAGTGAAVAAAAAPDQESPREQKSLFRSLKPKKGQQDKQERQRSKGLMSHVSTTGKISEFMQVYRVLLAEPEQRPRRQSQVFMLPTSHPGGGGVGGSGGGGGAGDPSSRPTSRTPGPAGLAAQLPTPPGSPWPTQSQLNFPSAASGVAPSGDQRGSLAASASGLGGMSGEPRLPSEASGSAAFGGPGDLRPSLGQQLLTMPLRGASGGEDSADGQAGPADSALAVTESGTGTRGTVPTSAAGGDGQGAQEQTGQVGLGQGSGTGAAEAAATPVAAGMAGRLGEGEIAAATEAATAARAPVAAGQGGAAEASPAAEGEREVAQPASYIVSAVGSCAVSAALNYIPSGAADAVVDGETAAAAAAAAGCAGNGGVGPFRSRGGTGGGGGSSVLRGATADGAYASTSPSCEASRVFSIGSGPGGGPGGMYCSTGTGPSGGTHTHTHTHRSMDLRPSGTSALYSSGPTSSPGGGGGGGLDVTLLGHLPPAGLSSASTGATAAAAAAAAATGGSGGGHLRSGSAATAVASTAAAVSGGDDGRMDGIPSGSASEVVLVEEQQGVAEEDGGADLVGQYLSGFADLSDPAFAELWAAHPERSLLKERCVMDVLQLRAKLAAQEAHDEVFDRDGFLF